MKPNASDVHVNRPLSTMSVGFYQEGGSRLADRLFPVVPNSKKSDSYFIWTLDDLRRDEVRERVGGAVAHDSNEGLTTASYTCDVMALRKALPDEVLDNADEALNLEASATRALAGKHVISDERDFAAAFMTTGIWTGGAGSDLTGGTDFVQWDSANSTPIQDVHEQIVAFKKATGIRPNRLAIGAEVEVALMNNPVILDRLKGITSAVPGLSVLSMLFFPNGDGEVVTSDVSYNSAAEGATASNAFAVGKSALLCYAAPSPGIDVPSAGYTFTWQRPGGSREGLRAYRYGVDERHTQYVELERCRVFKLVSAPLGIFFASAVA